MITQHFKQPALLLLAAVTIASLSTVAQAAGFSRLAGNVYAMDNNPDGNRIAVFGRFSNGSLRSFGSVSTGGLGAGDNAENDPLGSQGSIYISQNGRTLYAVNAGSNTVSAFYLTRRGRPILIQNIDSGGSFPVSMTSDGELLYVLNSGGDGAIAGFRFSQFGLLEPMENSIRSLGLGGEPVPAGGARNLAPGDIRFDSLARRLLIAYAGGGAPGTEEGQPPEGQLLSFALNNDGTPADTPSMTTSEGRVPFSVEFTANGTALVAEASGGLSSYDFDLNNELVTVSSSVSNGQTAVCWVRATDTGFAYTTNTNSNTISSFNVERNGELSLISGVAAEVQFPIDFNITDDNRFMYVNSSNSGGIAAYRIRRNGSLRDLGLFAGDLPVFAEDGYAPQGLAVR